LQTIWKELPQEHINKVVVNYKVVLNFTKRLTVYMAVKSCHKNTSTSWC